MRDISKQLGCCALAAIAVSGATGCVLANGTPIAIEQSEYVPFPPPTELRAGVTEVDVTPPPGFPSYGYSTNGVSEMRGTWLRLKARILVLEQPLLTGRHNDDEPLETVDESLLVLIQADFGASSALIHRGVAKRLGARGVSPANLVFATTHTHGGPGGIFQDKFFNKSVGARPLFVKPYVDWIVDQISAGVAHAIDDAHPAEIGFATALAPEGSTFNRSYDAWERNALDQGDRPDPSKSVDRTLRILRVDTQRDPSGVFAPEGVFSVFAAHGTAMPASYPLYHGDVHGLAARLGAHWIGEAYGTGHFVAAMSNGAEGDVSPGRITDPQGKDLVMDVAGAEASTMVRAFRSLDGKLSRTMRFRYGYHEVSMRGASTSRGKLCDEGALGAPEAAGSEASQGPLNGFLEMSEGAHRGFDGCQSRKIKILGGLQDAFYSPDEYPDTVPFQITTFAERAPELDNGLPSTEEPTLILASFPGEPTTGVGEMVRAEVKKSFPLGEVAIVGLTNSYATYFTTPSEYMVQDYEGGTTFYGPFQGVFGAEQLGLIAATVKAERPARAFLKSRVFQPGVSTDAVMPTGTCDSTAWKPGDVTFETQKRASGEPATLIAFHWRGAPADQRCALPSVTLECLPKGDAPSATERTFTDNRGWPVSDEGFDFEVFRSSDDQWTASWTRHGQTPSGAECRFVVEDTGARASTAPDRRVRWITSSPFLLEGQP